MWPLWNSFHLKVSKITRTSPYDLTSSNWFGYHWFISDLGELKEKSIRLLTYKRVILLNKFHLDHTFETLESHQWNLVYSIWYFCLEYLGFSIGPFHSIENYKEIYAQLSKRSLLEIRSRPKLHLPFTLDLRVVLTKPISFLKSLSDPTQTDSGFQWRHLPSILDDLEIQFQSRSTSDPTFSDIDFKNKMAWVWTTL